MGVHAFPPAVPSVYTITPLEQTPPKPCWVEFQGEEQFKKMDYEESLHYLLRAMISYLLI